MRELQKILRIRKKNLPSMLTKIIYGMFAGGWGPNIEGEA